MVTIYEMSIDNNHDSLMIEAYRLKQITKTDVLPREDRPYIILRLRTDTITIIVPLVSINTELPIHAKS